MQKASRTTCILLYLCMGFPGVAIPSSTDSPWSYEAIRGMLSLKVRVEAAAAPEPLPNLIISAENKGKDDLVLNLGHSIANGKSYSPDALGLVVIDGAGAVHYMRYASRVSMAAISRREDPYLVPLPAGSSYQMRCSLHDFWDDPTANPMRATKAGSQMFFFSKGCGYKMSVSLDPLRAQDVNSDIDMITYFNAKFALGRVDSEFITCLIPYK